MPKRSVMPGPVRKRSLLSKVAELTPLRVAKSKPSS